MQEARDEQGRLYPCCEWTKDNIHTEVIQINLNCKKLVLGNRDAIVVSRGGDSDTILFTDQIVSIDIEKCYKSSDEYCWSVIIRTSKNEYNIMSDIKNKDEIWDKLLVQK